MVATPYPPEPRERVLSAPISGIRDDRLLSSEDGKEFPVEGSGTSPSGPLRFSDTKLADATTVPEAPFPQPDLAEGEKLGGDDSVEVVGAFVEEVRFEMDTFLDLGLAGLELGYSRASAYSPEANVVLLESASGLRASFLVSNDGGVLVEQSHFSIVVDGYEFVLAPSVTLATVSETPRGTAISFGASDFVVGDFGGQFENLTTTSAEISHLKLRADFIVDDFGNIFESMLGSAITL